MALQLLSNLQKLVYRQHEPDEKVLEVPEVVPGTTLSDFLVTLLSKVYLRENNLEKGFYIDVFS